VLAMGGKKLIEPSSADKTSQPSEKSTKTFLTRNSANLFIRSLDPLAFLK
jgi:hypothetical protein